MKNNLFIKICVAATCLLFPFQAAGCVLTGDTQTQFVGITSIQKTSTDGLQDTYTIYFSDGTTSAFTVTNGENGKNGQNGANGTNGQDGKDLTAADLFETYKTIYGDSLTYEQFLQKYLVIDEPFETDHSAAINACLRSVGKIYCDFTEYNKETPFDQTDTTQASYTGACVVYRMDAEYTYFLTNYHVVYDENAISEKLATTAYCYLYGSEDKPVKMQKSTGEIYLDYGDYAIECTYVGGSVEYDLAVLQAKTEDVRKINENVAAVTLAENYRVGQTAIAIGNPNGDGISVTQGIVSVDNELISLSIDGTTRSYRSIRMDTPLYNGNSGGGVFDADGNLIGIANAGDTENQNVNYAIPLSIVKNVTENVLTHYADGDATTNGVYKPTLGVTVVSQNSRYEYDTKTSYGIIKEDVVVDGTVANGIAATLGLQAADRITGFEINGVSFFINRQFDIADLLLRLTDGVCFRVLYQRNGEDGVTADYQITLADLQRVA